MGSSAAAAAAAAALLALVISAASAQPAQCPSNGSKQLRFVGQISVSGCALFVHDTGAPDGPHLVVEPLMCVTESLQGVLPRYDPVTQQTYLSVSVMLRDDEMLAEVQRRLRLLTPKSVKFARVIDISVSTDASTSTSIEALGFDWSPDEPTGTLRLGCTLPILDKVGSASSTDCSITSIIFSLKNSQLDIFESIALSATLVLSDGSSRLTYNLMRQKQQLFTLNYFTRRYGCLPTCQHLQFFRSIRVGNCVAKVHQRMDMMGNFLVEPLLCFDGASLSNESVVFEHSRDLHYLKLDVLLQDEATLDAVKTQLADLSPRSVSFMHVWRAQSHVAAALSRRFEIGGLMVSGDWRSGHVRVYCGSEDYCKNLSVSVSENPYRLLRHIEWSVTSLVGAWCLYSSAEKSQMFSAPKLIAYDYGMQNLRWMDSCYSIRSAKPSLKVCQFSILPDGRRFVLIQQRLTGRVSFAKTWHEYEKGFGDETDFWIGLATIHLLTANGPTLRVEMKLWNGTELHAEYAGFKVGEASTIYIMTYEELSKNSNVKSKVLNYDSGTRFSTFNRDNDHWHTGSCSDRHGSAGWWFHKENTNFFNPNGLFPATAAEGPRSFASLRSGSSTANWLSLREVRLMLQI